jgi:uncharacterized membrane protein
MSARFPLTQPNRFSHSCRIGHCSAYGQQRDAITRTRGKSNMTRQQQENRSAERLAVGLGWFSIGLGLAELTAPRGLARFIGVRPTDDAVKVLRGFGAREVANGIAILAQPDDARWLWARVGGDALDLSTLSAAMRADDTSQGRAMAATLAVLGVTALDVICARGLSQQNGATESRRRGYLVERSTTVNRSIDQVYQFWRNFQNLSRFMRHLESVEVLNDRRSRWRAKGPAGLKVEWEAELLQDRPNEWIAWRSLPGSQVENSGSVRFQTAPGARGTEIHVQLEYRPPAGPVGRSVAWLFGEEPEQQIHEDLHRFKQLMETGEIPVSDGPGLWRPAQPAASPDEIRALAGVKS